MRFKIKAIPKKSISYIPVHYNAMIQGFLYKLLNEQMPQVHDVGYKAGNIIFRHFTFSRLYSDDMQIENGYMKIKNSVVFYCSFLLDSMSIAVLTEIMQGMQFFIGKETFEIVELKRFEEPFPEDLHEETPINMDFQTLSPIVNYKTIQKKEGKKETVYYSPFDQEFNELIRGNLIKKLISIEGEDAKTQEQKIAIFPINVDPDRMTSIVKYKSNFIKGYTGIFRFKGSVKLAKLAYETGVGSKNPQGFGMIMIRNIKKIV